MLKVNVVDALLSEHLHVRVEGLWFRFSAGFCVHGLVLGVQGLGLWGLGFRV